MGVALAVALSPLALFTPASPARTTAEFELAGSDGFSLVFEISRRTAAVTALRFQSLTALSAASYETRGSLAGDRARARFGSRGRVSVEFKPSGKVTRRNPPRRCEGRPRVTRFGAFVGTIRFAGEQGYTSVTASRASGSVLSASPWRCKRGRGLRAEPSIAPGSVRLGPNPGGESRTVLDADAGSGNDSTSFSVLATRPPGQSGTTSFIATRVERRPSMRVTRFAFVDGKDPSFSFDEALSAATATPPSPFGGTASFLHEPGGPATWTGSLSVDFPGAEAVALAGEDFSARLYRVDKDGIAKPGI